MFALSDSQLEQFLAEDVPFGDLTTESLGIGQIPARLSMRARGALTVAGIEIAERLMSRQGAAVVRTARSGETVADGTVLLTADADAGTILAVWKVAQVVVEYASGIATAARALVDTARIIRPDIVVACTRKSMPGSRALSVHAIKAGGAVPHRVGLSDSILIFPEHLALMGGPNALAEAVKKAKARAPEHSIAVEVVSVEQAAMAMDCGADVVQLEKFAPPLVAAVRDLRQDRPTRLAAAGGITLANAADYTRAGADVLVTTSPYTARPAEIAVRIEPR